MDPAGHGVPCILGIDRRKGGIEDLLLPQHTGRDFAKLGSLYLHEGRWQGQQLVPSEWVERSTRVDSSAGSAWWYQYQWWLPDKRGTFMAEASWVSTSTSIGPGGGDRAVGRKPGNADWVQVFRVWPRSTGKLSMGKAGALMRPCVAVMVAGRPG